MEDFGDVARARASYKVFLDAMNAGREIMRKVGVADPPEIPDFDTVFQRMSPQIRQELYSALRDEGRSPTETIRLWQPFIRRVFGA
jgi:hypothetical protein